MRRQFDQDPHPDINEVVAQLSEVFQRNVRKIGPVLLLVLAAVLAWAGFFVIEPGEKGVIRTFGKETGRKDPGLAFIIPLVQTLDKVNVQQIRRIEVGFRGAGENSGEIGYETSSIFPHRFGAKVSTYLRV